MHYELVSRALAYVCCFSTLSLFMTSMAIAAIHVGKERPLLFSTPTASIEGVVVATNTQFGGLSGGAHVEAVAMRFWSAKI